MKIITVANQKGGCGKTITTVNLASGLSAIGKKTILLDLDPQAHATTALGISIQDTYNSTYGIFDAFLKSKDVNFSTLMQQKYPRLWVIGSCISLSTMEQKMTEAKDAVLALSKMLGSEQLNQFDYCIIDTPPNLGFLTLNALHAAYRVIIPMDVSFFSLNGVSQIDSILELSKTMGFQKPQLNFLITLFDVRSNFAKDFLQNAKSRFPNTIMQTVIRSNIKLREAAQAAKAIFEYDPLSKGAADYISLIKELELDFKSEVINLKAPVINTELYKSQIFFKLYAPQATSVYLAGNFNNWILDEHSIMKKLDSGTWVKIMSLPQGTYRYRFVVDGKWIEDPVNKISETNEFGGKNSIVAVRR